MIKVLIADDHAIVRDGLKLVLQQDKLIKLVGEASDGEEAVKLEEELKPDIVVLDIDMPKVNGIEAAREIRKNNKDVKIIMLTMHETETFLLDAVSVGINGYIFKMSGMNEFLDAIHSVYAGNEVFSPNFAKIISQSVMKNVNKKAASKENIDAFLSKRELEVIQLVVSGLSNKQIAETLFLSIFTVKNHRKNILHKLGFKNTSQLIRYAIEKGIVKPERE